jgi:hypothetical protein
MNYYCTLVAVSALMIEMVPLYDNLIRQWYSIQSLYVVVSDKGIRQIFTLSYVEDPCTFQITHFSMTFS